MKREENCKGCYYNHKGCCCYEHPKPVTTAELGLQRAGNVVWPRVDPTDWCARHEMSPEFYEVTA